MFAFRRHYWMELENWIELSVICLASLSLGLQHLENVVKWISAFGIVLAFLEMIFLLGRHAGSPLNLAAFCHAVMSP